MIGDIVGGGMIDYRSVAECIRGIETEDVVRNGMSERDRSLQYCRRLHERLVLNPTTLFVMVTLWMA